MKDEKRHYLVTAASEKFPMTVGQPFTLGRSPEADLVARSVDVSRRHAAVDWRDDEPVLVEIDGRHGTFLNGQRVGKQVQPLAHGDRVRLASSTLFHYFHATPGALSIEMKNRGVGNLTSAYALADIEKKKATRRASRGIKRPQVIPEKGNLAATSGEQILTLLKSQQVNGVLSFFDGARQGELTIEAGVPVEGKVGRVKGPEAITLFRTMRQGTYRFREPRPPTVPREGSFTDRPALEVLITIYNARASGILTLQRESDQALRGRAVFVEGVCRSAGLGKRRGRDALDALGDLTEGLFTFEAKSQEELDGRLMTPRGRREAVEEDPNTE